VSVYVEDSRLVCLPFVSIKTYGFGNFWNNRVSHFDSFRTFKSCEGEDHVSHACTLRKTSKAHVRVYTNLGSGSIVNYQPMTLQYSKF
jgi:hypothetical protein